MSSPEYLCCRFMITCGDLRLQYRLPEYANSKGGCHVPSLIAADPVGNGTDQQPLTHRGGAPCILIDRAYTGNGDGAVFKTFTGSCVWSHLFDS